VTRIVISRQRIAPSDKNCFWIGGLLQSETNCAGEAVNGDKVLDDCSRGVLQLPDFQRSWVWEVS
jgi:hypothetical protein